MNIKTILNRSRHRTTTSDATATPVRLHPIILYTLLSTLITLSACRKDVSLFVPYEDSSDELQFTLAQVPDPATITTFIFDGLAQDTVLTTPGGVQVPLIDTDHLFQDQNGQTIAASSCPDLKIEIIEVIRKGDILARELPTRTMDNSPLETVAMVRVEASCGGVRLDLLPNRNINVRIPALDLQPDLSLWVGVEQNEELIGWEPSANQAAVGWGEWPNLDGTIIEGYDIIVKSLGWSSASVLIEDPVTSFCVSMPPGYDSGNSRVFLLLSNSKSVFELISNPDVDDDNVFCVENVPVGYSVRLVTLTKLGNQLLLGNALSEIGTNSLVGLAPEAEAEQEIIQFLKGL